MLPWCDMLCCLRGPVSSIPRVHSSGTSRQACEAGTGPQSSCRIAVCTFVERLPQDRTRTVLPGRVCVGVPPSSASRSCDCPTLVTALIIITAIIVLIITITSNAAVP